MPDKTFAGYQFVAEHCTQKEYVLFVDDDTFLKLNEIKAEMKKMSPEVDSLRCLKGQCITTEDRANYLSKYFLWVDTYPHNYFIPRYSNGQESSYKLSVILMTETCHKHIPPSTNVTNIESLRLYVTT